ncbi:cation diffusion facilitator family transporter [Bacillus sp. 03113]|uniref:cation diffusion facilitator family transporter n=1 Tax=Bacillus sp. 03113 TaxID=2578211 RepID=UPI0011437DA7|nr:cation diffusion facilitator family transporter [Bacillus sp. 03113]
MGLEHHHNGHPHTHGGVNGSLIKNKEGTKVLLISLIGLLLTAIFQTVIVTMTGSAALLADTIHNFGDALTSIPLWIAFVLSRQLPTKRFTYGLKRSEDFAGLFIVFVIFVSAVIAGYETLNKLSDETQVDHLGLTAIAAIVGYVGNEIVAIYRIRMGKRMGSAALIADGHHARFDSWTSLAVLIGVLGTWFGYPILDPIIGLIITVMILFTAKDSAKVIFTRLLDGIEPEYIDNITKSASKIKSIRNVNDVKARWLGHEIVIDISITIDSNLSIKEGHNVVKNLIHQLQHDIEHISSIQVHVDPLEEPGALFHKHEYYHTDHARQHTAHS